MIESVVTLVTTQASDPPPEEGDVVIVDHYQPLTNSITAHIERQNGYNAYRLRIKDGMGATLFTSDVVYAGSESANIVECTINGLQAATQYRCVGQASPDGMDFAGN